MMVDVEHVHSIDGIEYRSRALQLHIADDEEIGCVTCPLHGALDLLNPGQNAKGARDLIVDQHTRILALLPEAVHQPERRTDAVPIRTDVRGKDDSLCVGDHLCGFVECNLHSCSSFSAIGLSS